MPGTEDGLGRDRERSPPLTGDEAGQQGDGEEAAVRPAKAGPADLAAEHRQLVAQDEYLGVLCQGVRPVASDSRAMRAELVEEGEGHGSAWPRASELVKPRME